MVVYARRNNRPVQTLTNAQRASVGHYTSIQVSRCAAAPLTHEVTQGMVAHQRGRVGWDYSPLGVPARPPSLLVVARPTLQSTKLMSTMCELGGWYPFWICIGMLAAGVVAGICFGHARRK